MAALLSGENYTLPLQLKKCKNKINEIFQNTQGLIFVVDSNDRCKKNSFFKLEFDLDELLFYWGMFKVASIDRWE